MEEEPDSIEIPELPDVSNSSGYVRFITAAGRLDDQLTDYNELYQEPLSVLPPGPNPGLTDNTLLPYYNLLKTCTPEFPDGGLQVQSQSQSQTRR